MKKTCFILLVYVMCGSATIWSQKRVGYFENKEDENNKELIGIAKHNLQSTNKMVLYYNSNVINAFIASSNSFTDINTIDSSCRRHDNEFSGFSNTHIAPVKKNTFFNYHFCCDTDTDLLYSNHSGTYYRLFLKGNGTIEANNEISPINSEHYTMERVLKSFTEDSGKSDRAAVHTNPFFTGSIIYHDNNVQNIDFPDYNFVITEDFHNRKDDLSTIDAVILPGFNITTDLRNTDSSISNEKVNNKVSSKISTGNSGIGIIVFGKNTKNTTTSSISVTISKFLAPDQVRAGNFEITPKPPKKHSKEKDIHKIISGTLNEYGTRSQKNGNKTNASIRKEGVFRKKSNNNVKQDIGSTMKNSNPEYYQKHLYSIYQTTSGISEFTTYSKQNIPILHKRQQLLNDHFFISSIKRPWQTPEDYYPRTSFYALINQREDH